MGTRLKSVGDCEFCGSKTSEKKYTTCRPCRNSIRTKGLPSGVLIDDDLRSWAAGFTWTIVYHGKYEYARRRICERRVNGKQKQRYVYLHREIIGARSDQIVDHKNGNTLDNRLCNLRFVTRSENAHNRVGQQANNTSGYRGVTFNRGTGKWATNVTLNYIPIRLGEYASKEEAAQAIKAWRKDNAPSPREFENA